VVDDPTVVCQPDAIRTTLDIDDHLMRTPLDRSLESLREQGLVSAMDTGNAPGPGSLARLWSLTDQGRDALRGATLGPSLKNSS
jgi:hypothetical protein